MSTENPGNAQIVMYVNAGENRDAEGKLCWLEQWVLSTGRAAIVRWYGEPNDATNRYKHLVRELAKHGVAAKEIERYVHNEL